MTIQVQRTGKNGVMILNLKEKQMCMCVMTNDILEKDARDIINVYIN